MITKILVFILIIYLYAEADSFTSNAEALEDEDEDTAAQLYERTLQENYQTGIVKMIEFFNSLSERIASVSDAVADLTPLLVPQNPLGTTTECGGFLEVARGVPSIIRYPREGDYYSNWERCVWTMVPKVKFASYNIKVESVWMEGNKDGVKIYFWDSTGDLQSKKITEFGSWIFIPAPHVIITFCSDYSKVGGGFSASIVGFGASSDSATFRPFWLTDPTGNFSYPQDTSSTGSNEVVAVVVQPPKSQRVQVSVRVPQIGDDTIRPYELECDHKHDPPHYVLSARSEGGNNAEATYAFTSASLHPFLVIYKSNSRKSGLRFTISYFK